MLRTIIIVSTMLPARPSSGPATRAPVDMASEVLLFSTATISRQLPRKPATAQSGARNRNTRTPPTYLILVEQRRQSAAAQCQPDRRRAEHAPENDDHPRDAQDAARVTLAVSKCDRIEHRCA